MEMRNPDACGSSYEGFNIRTRNNISVGMWIRMEQMTGALAGIRPPAVHLMIFLTGFRSVSCLSDRMTLQHDLKKKIFH